MSIVKRWSTMTAIVSMTLLFASPVFAGWEDGNGLHEICADQERTPYGAGRCSGYIQGIQDGYDAHFIFFHCAPDNATHGQYRDVVKKWLADNPALRSSDGSVVVFSALREAWPQTHKLWKSKGDNGAVFSRSKIEGEGEWVTACDSKGGSNLDFKEFLPTWLIMPDNYKMRDIWFDEFKD